MIYLLVFIAILGVALIGYLLYALSIRLDSALVQISTRLAQVNKDLETLHANQKVLESDLKKVFSEIQNAQKENAKRSK